MLKQEFIFMFRHLPLGDPISKKSALSATYKCEENDLFVKIMKGSVCGFTFIAGNDKGKFYVTLNRVCMQVQSRKEMIFGGSINVIRASAVEDYYVFIMFRSNNNTTRLNYLAANASCSSSFEEASAIAVILIARDLSIGARPSASVGCDACP